MGTAREVVAGGSVEQAAALSRSDRRHVGLGPSGVFEPRVGVCGEGGEPPDRDGGRGRGGGTATVRSMSTSISGLVGVVPVHAASAGIWMVMIFARGVALRLFSGPATSSPEGMVRG